jgi:F-type H+-transporting ATPase subunit b
VLLAEYQKKCAAAEQEASSIVTEAKAEAERYAAESRVALKAQIERRGRQAEDKIAQAEAQAVTELRALAADAAIAAAEKLIAARVDSNQSAELVKRSLGEIPSKLN